MSDYMKEAERLIEEYGNAEWKVGKMSEHSDDAEEIVTRENARAALLAHIQRGAAEHSLEDVRCGCCGYMTYHREHMGCIRAAAPAPDQFPDAAKMMAEPAEVPSADQLWNNDEVMALNAELGLTLDQMSRLVRAALRGEVKP